MSALHFFFCSLIIKLILLIKNSLCKFKCELLPEFLLALQRVLELVKGLLKLGLHLVEVIDFVFGGLEVFGGLLVDFLHVLLLLVELVDELILVGDLVVQVADLVILGGLVGLGLQEKDRVVIDGSISMFQDDSLYLLEGQFEVFDVLLESRSFLFQLLLVLEELVAGIFFLLQTLLGVLFLLCNIQLFLFFLTKDRDFAHADKEKKKG